jgi:hypothetical protein
MVTTFTRGKGMAEQPMTDTQQVSEQVLERRRRVALRALIDEMLSELRQAANREEWTPEARVNAEADLARIMEQVRREALAEHRKR